MLRYRPLMPTLGGLPISPDHRRVSSTQNHPGGDVALLNQMLPAPSPAASLGNSMNFHPPSTGSEEARFQYSACSSRRISLDQTQMDPYSIGLAGGKLSNDHRHSRSQSPHSVIPTEPGPYLLVNTHETISTCDAAHIFQHFKGTTLHVTTQAHLEFILREYPNSYAPGEELFLLSGTKRIREINPDESPQIIVPPHKHPSVLGPKLYHTMLADVISWFVCGQASVSDRPDSSSGTQESLFIKMLDYDRGENNFQESTMHAGEGGSNPLTQLTYQELDFIYSRWLCGNPFAFLFNDATPTQQSIHLAENSAFLATVIGWHFYLSSHSRKYASPQTPHPHLHIPARCHMPFFEYAEAQLMSRAIRFSAQMRLGIAECCTITLEGIFVIIEASQTSTKCLYKSWTLLSMQFPKSKVHAMINASPSYLEAYLSHARMNSSSVHTEWANRMLLNTSQILEVFCTLCQEDPPHTILPDPTAKQTSNDWLYENKLYLIRWLMDTAKMRCQVMGTYDSPPSHPTRATGRDIRNAHSNIVLAVVFSIFALSRLVHLEDITPSNFTRIPIPIFRDVLKLLQIITAEGADSIVAIGSIHQSGTLGEALLLRILQGLFPYFLILAQAFANTLRDFANTSTSDSTHLTNQLLEVVESLGRFASAGLSSYPAEDFQVIEEVRGRVVSLSVMLRASFQISGSQEQAGAFQPPDSVPFCETTQIQSFVKPSRESERLASEPFENSVVRQAHHIPTNSYSSESTVMINSYSRATQAVSTEGIFDSNDAAQLSFQMSSADIGGVSSSPPPSDPASSASYPFQTNHDPEAKSENLLIPSQGSGLLLSFPGSQGLIEPSEITGTEINSRPGVFGCPRGADPYFCALDSSWINQPPLHQIDLESHSHSQALDSFPRTRTPHHLTPPLGSPPGYRLHSPCLDYFPNNLEFHESSMGNILVTDSTSRSFVPQELIEPSSGFQYDAFARPETSRPSTPTR
ncbi:hypothetical protein PtB15_8B601 [Puccinia triticina]|nr:hypothetical protein PtB15_8B601 [Puccinia triticina]